MTKVPSKIRRNLVIAGAAGIATLAVPKVWQNRLAQSIALPAAAQTIPPKTGEVKVQHGYRKGRWGIEAHGHNTIPLAIYNQFAEGTQPVVHEVQVHFRLDFPSVKHLGVVLISPDGHSVRLLNRPGTIWAKSCSTKGVDITFVDSDNEGEDWAVFGPRWCPERLGRDPVSGRIVGKNANHYLVGMFHTHPHPNQRLLPQFNGRPAAGNWYLRVYNHLDRKVNKAIKQIDLTVYSKW